MHLYRLGELTLYSLTDIRVPINRVHCTIIHSPIIVKFVYLFELLFHLFVYFS